MRKDSRRLASLDKNFDAGNDYFSLRFQEKDALLLKCSRSVFDKFDLWGESYFFLQMFTPSCGKQQLPSLWSQFSVHAFCCRIFHYNSISAAPSPGKASTCWHKTGPCSFSISLGFKHTVENQDLSAEKKSLLFTDSKHHRSVSFQNQCSIWIALNSSSVFFLDEMCLGGKHHMATVQVGSALFKWICQVKILWIKWTPNS